MTVSCKLLNSFVKAVELESISSAAAYLHIAQPALSQHINLLERHFAQRLLIRTNVGVSPTGAGRELYRNALLILDQLLDNRPNRTSRARLTSFRGDVSVGLATYSTTVDSFYAALEERPGATIPMSTCS